MLISRSLSSTSSLPDIVLLITAGVLLIGGAVRIIATCAVALATVDLVALNTASTIHLLDSVAVAILGPGAYSLDARLFGRRVIRIGRPRLPSLPPPDG
ncbi:MAG TPA: hypothetical protein PLH23_09985 [Hyphomonadaceae bacterium]|nr:hypothetical protein [Hyphomonadaceae bacterium]HPI48587.1 hypothetical protein [Hyphomonadaceae bacterium]